MGEQCVNKTLVGSYGVDTSFQVYQVVKKLKHIRGATVLIIGTYRPWLEVCALAAGAKQGVTLEYGRILSTDSRIHTYRPEEFDRRYRRTLGSSGSFDVVLAFSSDEHSGLGRNGDIVNPWGDLIAVAKAWCLSKPGATLLLGMDTSKHRDVLKWNWGRVYGPHRWSMVAANWKHLTTEFVANQRFEVIHTYTKLEP